MGYSAVEDLGEAYEATRALLLPFDLRRWLVLAAVVIFVSGTSSFDVTANPGFADVPVQPIPAPTPPVPDPGTTALVLVAVVAAVVALAVLFVASALEFVFVRILERRDVRVRPYLGPAVPKGLSLFVLRLVVGLAVLASALFLVVLALGGGVAFLLVLLLLSPVVAVALLGLYLFHRFTVDFVVPVMLVADVGVVAGWRRLATEIRAAPEEYGVYALVRAGLGIAAAVVAGVGFTMVGLVVAIPFALVGGVVYLVGVVAGPGPALWVVLWGLVALYAVVTLLVGVTLVQVPISSYLRYYSLLVLADVSPAYDLVADVRAHLRGEAPPAPRGDDGDWSDVGDRDDDGGGPSAGDEYGEGGDRGGNGPAGGGDDAGSADGDGDEDGGDAAPGGGTAGDDGDDGGAGADGDVDASDDATTDTESGDATDEGALSDPLETDTEEPDRYG